MTHGSGIWKMGFLNVASVWVTIRSMGLSPVALNLTVPTALHDVSTEILDPRQTYSDVKVWEEKARSLGAKYIKNFEQYTDTEDGKKLIPAGPKL